MKRHNAPRFPVGFGFDLAAGFADKMAVCGTLFTDAVDMATDAVAVGSFGMHGKYFLLVGCSYDKLTKCQNVRVLWVQCSKNK